ncbi:MEKHLA domain-containing protein [Mangrovimicrobium sediminis]|uniref:MEKHLA domain-containing protein n=1 Tax=Mangrovimicrobium sediminis TaxID=2562682 RepID=A0A4Z0LUB3_9GAMM|nr:EAL domain-containing protein [Haliea sp. SAOS-164]TGD70839.1 MEKHLA domain-containing protein [Haliea sp. SAOS-164]
MVNYSLISAALSRTSKAHLVEQYCEAIVESSDDAIVGKTIDGRVISWNSAAERLFGYTAKEVQGQSIVFLIPADRVDEEATLLGRVARGERIQHYFTERIHKDGYTVPVSLALSPVRDSAGEVIGVSGIARDITDQLRLACAESRFAALVENSDDAIISKTLDGVVTSWNQGAQRIFGYSAEEMIGQPMLRLFPQELAHEEREILDRVRAGNKVDHYKSERLDKHGRRIHVSVTISPICDARGRIVGVSSIARDITEQVQVQEVVEHHANYDALTGLPNRRLFDIRLGEFMARTRNSGKPFALIYMDLNKFKQVNDTLGHDAGDAVLVHAAKQIRGSIRSEDFAARFGGDEFLVLLGDVKGSREARLVAEKLMENLRQPLQYAGRELSICASVGIAVHSRPGESGKELIQRADQALYQAKDRGGNCLQVYDRVLGACRTRHNQLLADLPIALERDQFDLHFQPIIDLRDNSVSKAEALMRWHHPEFGPVGPDEFIPIAEENGYICELGEWVFDSVMRILPEWVALFGPNFQVGINKSPLQFLSDETMPTRWAQRLQQAGLDGRNLVVEITENSLMGRADIVTQKMALIAEAGMQVAIDDFGTGYSSLSYLNRFPVDYLKIDRAFVRDLTRDSRDFVLCEAMVAMAHKLNMRVVAEGVETAEQRSLLAGIGCDYGQGYLYSPPLGRREFLAFMYTSCPLRAFATA